MYCSARDLARYAMNAKFYFVKMSPNGYWQSREMSLDIPYGGNKKALNASEPRANPCLTGRGMRGGKGCIFYRIQNCIAGISEFL